MNGYFPDLISRKIERDDFLDPILKEIEKVDIRKKSQEESEQIFQARLDRIRLCCSAFKAACPGQWATFERDLVQIHGSNFAKDRLSPSEVADDWGIYKAHLNGRMQILDSILSTIDLTPEKFRDILVSNEKKSFSKFFKKLFDSFLKCVRTTSGLAR